MFNRERLMSVKEVAYFLGCSREGVYWYMKKGLPYLQMPEGRKKFRRREVLQWLEGLRGKGSIG